MAQTLPEPRIEIVRRGRWLQIGSPDGFEWTRVHLPIRALAPSLVGFRIVQLTDIHLTEKWWPAYEDLQRAVNENPPDLILCTGDFVEYKWKRKESLPILQRFVDGFHARLGMWGILGNHDGDLLLPHLVSFRLHLLNRARTLLEAGSEAIELIGLPGVNRLDLDDEFLQSLPPREPGRLRIVMQHYPDQIRRTVKLEPDIVFAGHTHGGQLCLPGGHPILRHDGLPTRYCSGVNEYHGTWLVVSRGIGFSSIPMRVFCPSQVIEVVLVSC